MDEGPLNAGLSGASWRSPMLQQLIDDRVGVFYNVLYMAQWLKNLGFSDQRAAFISDHLDEGKRLAWCTMRTKKKEAVVTGLYTISPYPRIPQEEVAALLDDEHPRSTARPVPVGKEPRATLTGKADAMSRLAQQVDQHEGPHIQQRVGLTDGAEALQ
jgi:hypothetical protein